MKLINLGRRIGNTLEAFIALAAKASTSTSPDLAPGSGGVLAVNNNTALSASSVVTSAVATSYSVSTYTTSGHAVTTTLATQTAFETILIGATAVAAASAASAASSNSAASASSAASKTSTAGAPEKTAHMLGAAVLGLGALALL